MKKLFVIGMVMLLTACSQQYMVKNDLDYAYNLPPVGSTLLVKKPIEVPGGATRIFLQRGELFRKADFDRYHPSCSLELRKLAEVARVIQPGSFTISKVQRLMQEVVRREAPAPGLMRVDYEGGKPMVVHGYHLWLGSAEQPDVMRMTCRGYFDDLNRAEPPSLNDVFESMGDYAELILAI